MHLAGASVSYGHISSFTWLSYFICWLVLVRTRPLLILGSLRQRSRSHGTLLIKKKIPLIILWTINHIIFIFHMLIGFGEDMTCNDFELTRWKVKVTRVLYLKQWCSLIILRNIYHRAIIFHMVLDLGEAMTPFDFGFTRLKVKVTRVTCKKCTHGFCPLSWEYLSYSFYIIHADWSW